MTTRLPPRCESLYRLGEPLAVGGSGASFRATHIGLGRSVALKLVHPGLRTGDRDLERFRAEAALAASLSHPNLVKVLDYDVEEGLPWIATEFVAGPSLCARIEQGQTRWPLAVRLAAQTASVLAAAHAGGLLHRDVKPGNVLESRPGFAKVTDFGIASWSGKALEHQAGPIFGTPDYLAPEVAQGGSASVASDLYALGVMLFELLAGKKPFVGGDAVAVLRAHVQQPVPRLEERRADLPAELIGLVVMLLSKSPEGRPASALELAAVLEGMLDFIGDVSLEMPHL